ncbi:hypothetical protein E8E14_010010 [Neopestalotiopsis sp. 37M]|nr:hypothetical protein E8E14_010010 [Neopestalotiopsis sp. 37M]
MFLGTPHRGSHLAELAETARRIVSAVGMDTNSRILNSLGLRTSELDRVQTSFSNVWHTYGFRVKTFQEGLGFMPTSIIDMNKKVVDNISSALGDAREDAETLQANHTEMCRFRDADDPNAVKVLGELRIIYNWVLSSWTLPHVPNLPLDKSTHVTPPNHGPNPGSDDQLCMPLREEIDYLLTASLNSFEFPGIIAKFPVITHKSSSLVTIEKLWSDHLSSKNKSKKTRRLLWIKGSLGSGKSTLMKEAFLRHPAEGQHTAAFFCDASAKEVRLRSASGMLQSLLYQLLPLCFRGDIRRRDLIDILETKYKRATSAGVQMEWESEELVQLLRTVVSQNSDRDIVLFIDALDQYPENDRIFIIDCLEHLSSKENEIYSRVHIWISSRDQILLVPEGCLSVQIESANWEDINNYVDEKLKLYPKRNLDEFSKFKVKLKKRSSGNFLWVVLVVDIIRRRMLHAQYNVKSMESQLGELPERLHELYYTLLQEAHEHRLIRLKFFQWAILSDDLTLEHWQHILPFLGHPIPRTLALCEASEFWEGNCTNVGDQVSYLSLGLFRASLPLEEIEVPADFESEKSMDGTAGSMDSRAGNSRKVRPVHESVRTFFLQHNGFSAVAEAGQSYNLADGYITILHTCLDFVSLEDFDGLVELRRQAFSTDRTRPRPVRSDKLSQKSSRSQSVASFSSASSRHGHWDPSGASTYSANQGSRMKVSGTGGFASMRSIL